MPAGRDFLTTADGLRLHLHHWPAPAGARGTVHLVHGLGEHVGRYAALAAELNHAGWHVAGHDQRGHGASEGQRGAIGGPHALLADLAVVSDHFRGSPFSGKRQLLFGHSLGGLVAARFVAEGLRPQPARWLREFDGLVLSSPAFDAGLKAPQRLLLALLGGVAPHFSAGNGLKPAWISRDAAVVAAYRSDPLVHRRVTPRMVHFMLDAAGAVLAAAPRWRTPTLLMWAGADRCVAPAGSAAFAAAAPAAVVEAQVWPNLFHEIFNEPERAQVMARLTAWLPRFEVLDSPIRRPESPP